MIEIAMRAKAASDEMMSIELKMRHEALIMMKDTLKMNQEAILDANSIDVQEAIDKCMSDTLIDRLTLTSERIDGMIHQLDTVLNLPNPLNLTTYSYQGEQGFLIETKTVPIGVLLMIYEARPNVSVEATSLAIKSGNTIILRGSSSTLNTNRLLVSLLHEAGTYAGLPSHFIQLVDSSNRDDLKALLKLNQMIDVVIPRGGESLIQMVKANTSIPMIETGTGNNFAYIDETCNIDEAIKVIVNAKTSRPSVCNALEKVLVNKAVGESFYEKLDCELKHHAVRIHACEETQPFFDDALIFEEKDLDIEYLDYEIGIMMVDDIKHAVCLMNEHSSKHSNLILSNQYDQINYFTNHIDAACIYVNVSTRFSDGAEFGMGAEIGISTQKLHARGPMGLKALTTTKSIITGDFNIR